MFFLINKKTYYFNYSYSSGGIGKTTLARLVYDHYLEDYTEAAYVELGQNANLLECINVLLKKLGVTSEADDATKTECWKACLRRKKVMYKPVLLLLDNVWDQGDLETLLQMDLLARGSRVIITTRLEGILDKFADSVQKIEVPGLNDEEAKKLLRSSARIKDTMMNENLLVCEEKIIKGCFGVPLLLKVVGGVLLPNRTDKDSWEVSFYFTSSLLSITLPLQASNPFSFVILKHVCARLSDFDSGSKALDEKIQKILSLQLELVDGLCRDMFYDVATALHGWPIDQCLRAWALMYNDELGNDAKMKVITRCTDLLDTSLVKFDDENGVVQIHDILRHLGRVQCRSEGKRVWVEDGKLQGLKIFKGVSVLISHGNGVPLRKFIA